MSGRTLVYFVCSPHSRTGVTTTARLLTEYYLSRGVTVEGFDTDAREPSYAERFPDLARAVNIFDVRGQIALFDQLLVPDDKPKIVDVWSYSFDQLFAIITEIGFLDEAARAGVTPVVLYQADMSQMAANTCRSLGATWPDLWVSVVHNEGASPLGLDARETLAGYRTRGKLVIPKLERPIARFLDDPDFLLSEFLRQPPPALSLVVRAAIRNWALPIFTQFQSFELRLVLQSSKFLR